MNYFAHQTAAERYAQSRPYFHPLVIERIRDFLGLREPVPVGLDVACGTGNSALALTAIARSVVATDLSPAMLAYAPAHDRIRYVEAPAENLPVQSQSVDLITVSLAFHWLDRRRFLAEAHRVLRPGGALVIYWYAFRGEMKESPAFTRWYQETYFTRHPKTPRNDQPFTDEDAVANHFAFAGREHYTNEISFTPEQMTTHLTTHSNVIAKVEQGGESLESVKSWILNSIRPLFPSTTGTFGFGGDIWFLHPLQANGAETSAR